MLAAQGAAGQRPLSSVRNSTGQCATSSLEPIGYTWSYMACRIGYLGPILPLERHVNSVQHSVLAQSHALVGCAGTTAGHRMVFDGVDVAVGGRRNSCKCRGCRWRPWTVRCCCACLPGKGRATFGGKGGIIGHLIPIWPH
jgi:hypothetical protein